MLPVDTHEVYAGVACGSLFSGTLAECRAFVAREIRIARRKVGYGHWKGAWIDDRNRWQIVLRPHVLYTGQPISETVTIRPIVRRACWECGFADCYVLFDGEEVCECRVPVEDEE